MVLKLQLDFSWISFCPKIVADQEIGIWTSLEHHLGTIEFFEKISNQNSNFEDFEKFEKISRCENNEKMTFKIVIFGFNFCQKATSQVPSQKQARFKHWFDSFSLSSSPKIIRKWPFLTGNLKKSKIQEISCPFGIIFRAKNEMISRKCDNLARFFEET